MAALFAVFVASCVLALTWIDGRRIALRDAEIARLDAAREADADEAAATYQAALDLCEYLGGEIDRLRILSVRRQDEIEALRCGDLVAFGPGWLLAYAVGAVLWILIFEVTPIPVIIAVAALGLLGYVWLGNKFDSGEFPPPEDR